MECIDARGEIAAASSSSSSSGGKGKGGKSKGGASAGSSSAVGVDAAVAMDRADALLGLAELSEVNKSRPDTYIQPYIHTYIHTRTYTNIH